MGKTKRTYYAGYKSRGKVDTWHRVTAHSKNEAVGTMLRGTRYNYSDVAIRKRKPVGIPVAGGRKAMASLRKLGYKPKRRS